jgi:hypothetical protein
MKDKLLTAIRFKCLACAGSPRAVHLCQAKNCALYHYREKETENPDLSPRIRWL